MSTSKFPKRPDIGGSSGQPVALRVNMMKVNGIAKGVVYQYDVNISQRGRPVPEQPAPRVKNVVIKNPTKPTFNRPLISRLIKENQSFFQGIKVAYDGNAIIYTTRYLPGNDLCDRSFELVEEENPGKPETWDVVIKYVAEVPMSILNDYLAGKTAEIPQRAITAIDVMLMHDPSHSNRFFPRGNNLYSMNVSDSIGGMVRAHQGFYTSARPCKGGLYVNLDLSCTSFYDAKTILEVLVAELRLNNVNELASYHLTPRDISSLKQKLRTVQVETSHRADYNRKIRIMGISAKNANTATFRDSNDKEISVAEYFRNQYNCQLRFPNLPCLECGTKKSLFPMELCRIVPGQFYRKLDPDQTANMIKVTCTKPDVRSRKINEGIAHLGLTNNAHLAELGMSVSAQMAQVKGRVLPPPGLKYGPKPVAPQMGAWNLRDLVFTKGATLQNWGVLVMANPRYASPQKVSRFVSDLGRMATKVGLRVVDREPVILHKSDRDDVARCLHELNGKIVAKKATLSFVLCIIDGGEAIYREIKRFCDSVVGIPSQCMLSKNLGRDQGPSPQYLGNILLKINAKLGGHNHEMVNNLEKTFPEPTMVMGADVTHPSGRGDTVRPSIVALVGSQDSGMSRYSAVLGLQDSTQEHIDKLKPMVKQQLYRFYRANQSTGPKRLIFFRDGVSEGQFAQVFSLEITAIRAACAEIQAGYSPRITFVVVQKRHHVRFFPGDPRTPLDRSGNVCPGTVVDTDIVNPTDFDFYMMTHAGIQGTSRPAHYYVLYDENGFTSDSLQKFINDMSYTSVRCTRSTSIPPPVFYAHLVAYRGRLLAEADLWEGSDTASSSGRGGTGSGSRSKAPTEDEKKMLKPHPNFDVALLKVKVKADVV